MPTINPELALGKIKSLIKSGDFISAYEIMQSVVCSDMNYVDLFKYFKTFKRIPSTELNLIPIKIAVVASSTVDHFLDILRLFLGLDGFVPEFFLSKFGTVFQSLLNPASDVYSFRPDVIWIFTNYRDLDLRVPNGATATETANVVFACVQQYSQLWATVRKYSDAIILQNNADLPSVRIFGNFEGNVPWSRLNSIRDFNLQLGNNIPAGVTIFDIDYISSLYGKLKWHDERMWYHSKHSFSLEASGIVAFYSSRLIKSLKGKAKKCIVLDLDNTLWGGIIGDDGLHGIVLGTGAAGESFKDFQKYLLQLKQRGIILTVCSKNEEVNAKIPFEQHPDMCIKCEDIAVFVANWESKAHNIEYIASALGIGLDSMVFIDDNPVERELVKRMLPLVEVPDMPDDPASYIRAIDTKCFFETTIFSAEDRTRSDMYKENAQRKITQSQCPDLDTFLAGLNMEAVSGNFDSLYIPRITQLINKSNQFHLTTTRYTEFEVTQLASDATTICRYFKLRDRFGDNGLISLYILKKSGPDELTIDTFVMSCRVLSRGMESFVLNDIVVSARNVGATRLVGVYKPTAKNGLVSELYGRLGFSLIDNCEGVKTYLLCISKDTPVPCCYIKSIDTS